MLFRSGTLVAVVRRAADERLSVGEFRIVAGSILRRRRIRVAYFAVLAVDGGNERSGRLQILGCDAIMDRVPRGD